MPYCCGDTTVSAELPATNLLHQASPAAAVLLRHLAQNQQQLHKAQDASCRSKGRHIVSLSITPGSDPPITARIHVIHQACLGCSLQACASNQPGMLHVQHAERHIGFESPAKRHMCFLAVQLAARTGRVALHTTSLGMAWKNQSCGHSGHSGEGWSAVPGMYPPCLAFSPSCPSPSICHMCHEPCEMLGAKAT
jgi:hypothetical protein